LTFLNSGRKKDIIRFIKMWQNSINCNYALGFIIVLFLLYLSLITWVSMKSERYAVTTDPKIPRIGITIVTNEGVVNMDKLMMDHYLNRMKDNLEYLSKRVDPDKCEKIKEHLIKARASLQEQILKSSENFDVYGEQSDLQDERRKLRERVGKMSEVMFSNEQNPDDASSIIVEMILDIETLLYLVKIIPHEIKAIDLRNVDQISKIIYEQACLPKNPSPQTLSGDLIPTEFTSETSPGNDLFIAEPQKSPGSFETFADFNKHQNLSDDNNAAYRSNNMSYKTRKNKLRGIRKTSMRLGGEDIKKENHKALHTQKRETKKLREHHKDPIRDRVTNAQETFISAHPNRYKKTKSSLIEDYNAIEDHTLFPALAFAY
jgi:hypothetical protein